MSSLEELSLLLKEEAEKLSGQNIYISEGPRFISLRYISITSGFDYTYARIEADTGDIYSHAGKKPVGNIYESPYGGAEFIGPRGVIVNRTAAKRRMKQLEGDN